MELMTEQEIKTTVLALDTLYKAFPKSAWLDLEQRAAGIDQLIEIGFVMRTRDGFKITAAGICFYILASKVASWLVE